MSSQHNVSSCIEPRLPKRLRNFMPWQSSRNSGHGDDVHDFDLRPVLPSRLAFEVVCQVVFHLIKLPWFVSVEKRTAFKEGIDWMFRCPMLPGRDIELHVARRLCKFFQRFRPLSTKLVYVWKVRLLKGWYLQIVLQYMLLCLLPRFQFGFG